MRQETDEGGCPFLANAKPPGCFGGFPRSQINDRLFIFGIGLGLFENTLVLGWGAHGFIGKSPMHGAVLVDEA